MATLTPDDELLIQKFIGLNTKDNRGAVVQLPDNAASSTNWDCTIIAKVISNRPMLDSSFQTNMIKAWNVDPAVVFKSLGDSTYLVEFMHEDEATKVIVGGPWTLRGDLVAVRRVSSHLSLNPDLLKTGDLWVQFHNAPINLTDEGIAIMARQVGSLMSAPIEGFVGERRFIKLKISVKLGEPLKDRVSFTHRSLGEVTVLCGSLGHEMSTCTNYLRLGHLASQMGQEGPYDFEALLKPKFGKWLINPSLVPRPNSNITAQSPTKRPFTETSSPMNHSGPRQEKQLPIAIISDGLQSQREPVNSHPVKRPRLAGPNPSAKDI